MDGGAFSSHATNNNKKTSFILIADSIVYGFKCYKNIWRSYFAKEALNCKVRGNKLENLFCRINKLNILHHTNTVIITCGKNLDGDKPSDITNGLICAEALLQLKEVIKNKLTRIAKFSFHQVTLVDVRKPIKDKVR